MRLSKYFRWFRPSTNCARPVRLPKTPTVRLCVAQLEERTVPTVVFEPHFGAEPTSYFGAAVLSDTPVQLLFWGSYWNSSAGAASKQQMITAITNMYNSSIYDRLSQYTDLVGDHAGPAYLYSTWTATEFPDPSPSGFTDGQLQQVVGDAINDPNSPILSPVHMELIDGGHAPLYLVITPPNITCTSQPGAGGYHSEYFSFPQSIIYGWVGNFGSLDSTTVITSHETAEAMTDPAAIASWVVQPGASWPGGGSGYWEIGDLEAQSYTYRIYGSLTQAFWDNNAQAFTVSDGNAEKFFVYPQWNASNQYVGNTLNIVGDQLGANDTVTVNTTPSGGLWVNLNGEVVTFDPGQITTLNIMTGGGSNTVNVMGTPYGMTTYIDDAGQDTVHLGYGGTTANLWGDVHVYGSGSTSLYLYDSGDTVGRTVTLSRDEATGLAPATLSWTPTSTSTGGVTSLAVYGGSGGNTFNVQDTPYLYSNTYLSTGSGNDTVNVYATLSPLYVNNPGGLDDVYVGLGSLTNIYGLVDVVGAGATNLFPNDSSDTTGRTVSLYNGYLTGLAPANIYWTPTSSASGGVIGVHVWGGSGGNTFNIYNTSNFYHWTALDTGTGNNTVNVYATSGTLYDRNDGGADTTDIGLGSLANVNGPVYVSGAGSTNLILDDTLDTADRTVSVYAGEVAGLAPANIYWTANTLGSLSGGVDYLEVRNGPASNTINVYGTSSFYYYTYLNGTGGGVSSVNVQATSPRVGTGAISLYVNGGNGDQRVTIGSLAPSLGGTVANIKGDVDVFNSSESGSSQLLIDDSGDATARTATLGRLVGLTSIGNEELTGLAPAPLVCFAGSGGVTSLTIDGGSGGNTFNLQYTAPGATTTLNAGSGNDTINVGNSANRLDDIQGPVTVNGQGGTNHLNLIDSGQTAGQSYTLAGNTLTRPGMAPISYLGVQHVALKAGGGNDAVSVSSAPPAGTAVTLDGGGGSNTLVGPNITNTWTVSAPNAGSLDGIGFTSFQNLVGGTGVDTFKFGPKGQVSSINGGGAPAGQGDWLNYSAFPSTSPVTVNLATGSATGVAGGAAGAVVNIQNVIGGAGTDTLTGNAQGNILLGGAGTNVITGGSGRSLLIGGAGKSTITGGAGDDILIAGTATYDANEKALMAILKEWQRTDRTYAQRISDLRTGGAGTYNGSAKLIWGTTVLDNDIAPAKLTGGLGLDWFFANLGPGGVVDTITDRNNGGAEQVN
jgi:hypothetical protein